jgi:hypothetical protein
MVVKRGKFLARQHAPLRHHKKRPFHHELAIKKSAFRTIFAKPLETSTPPAFWLAQKSNRKSTWADDQKRPDKTLGEEQAAMFHVEHRYSRDTGRASEMKSGSTVISDENGAKG